MIINVTDDDGDGTPTIEEDYDGDGDPTNDDINQNGIPDYLDEEVTSGLNLLTKESIMVYPIPSKEYINIRFKSLEITAIVNLYTVDGKCLYTNIYTLTHEVRIRLPEGKDLYHLIVRLEKGILHRTIIKN